MSTPSMVIIGNLTADPELRFTQSGQAVSNFTVASTAKVLNKQTNEWEDGDTTFVRCSVWQQAGENVAETLTKGMRVIVTGRLKVRQYEASDGSKGTSVECTVDEVGPSLKWASGRMTRNERSQQGGSRPAAQQQSRQQSDPWAGTAGSQFPDEPPF